MKTTAFLTFATSCCVAGLLCAQPAGEIPPPQVPAAPGDQPAAPADIPAQPAELPDAAAGQPTPAPAPAADATVNPADAPKTDMLKADEGYILKDAPINDIFQFLAKEAGKQYFHNAKITGPEFLVTGHLNDGSPLTQMEELAFMYGLSLHTKGNTIYALTSAQLAQLPAMEFHYQLRYLRPTDMEQIKELIKPMLSPGTGIVNFEPKTNTIIIIDSAHRIDQARRMLYSIDQVKGQIIVETKILRVNSGAAERTGVNWSSSLGKDGTSLDVAMNLSEIFGLEMPKINPGADAGATPTTTTPGSNVVLSPIQLTGVLRALAEGNLASQISNPTLITEDNEQATISIIDRVPIITTTQTANSGGTTANPTVTEEVRYKIDTADKGIDTDPEKHREIGISLVVTPTVLPDGTVRMKMRPRSAQITERIKSITGNEYPRVTESMIETLARVPDGHSLVVGGFYGEAKINGKTKVPVLGDVPVLNFFFKSKDATKEKTSLVFVVTPKSYNPSSASSTRSASNRLRDITTLDCEADWVDPDNPGPAHEPNVKRTLRGLQPDQAPYYPRIDERRATQPEPYSPPAQPSGKTSTSFGRGSRL